MIGTLIVVVFVVVVGANILKCISEIKSDVRILHDRIAMLERQIDRITFKKFPELYDEINKSHTETLDLGINNMQTIKEYMTYMQDAIVRIDKSIQLLSKTKHGE